MLFRGAGCIGSPLFLIIIIWRCAVEKIAFFCRMFLCILPVSLPRYLPKVFRLYGQ